MDHMQAPEEEALAVPLETHQGQAKARKDPEALYVHWDSLYQAMLEVLVALAHHPLFAIPKSHLKAINSKLLNCAATPTLGSLSKSNA